MTDIKRITKLVEHCLQEYPQTRNSDISLTIKVWTVFYPDSITTVEAKMLVDLKLLFDLPREDHVKRIRARFNAIGLYLPTVEAVAKQRRLNMDDWRQAMTRGGHRELDLT